MRKAYEKREELFEKLSSNKKMFTGIKKKGTKKVVMHTL